MKAFAVLARDAGVRWADDSCYRLGAALAYYAVFSIFPLVLLSLTALGLVLGSDDGIRRQLVGSLSGVASPEALVLVDQTLQSLQTHRTARGAGAVVGAVTLLFGASGVFSELQSSLDSIWKVETVTRPGIWATLWGLVRSKAASFAVVVGAAGALLASLVASTALMAIQNTVADGAGAGALWRALDAAVSIALSMALLAATYRMVPQTRIAWRDVLGAAALTSILFAITKVLLAWYLAHLGSFAAYGVVGGVLGLMTWIYVSTLLLFYGAEFSRVYAEHFGSRRESTGNSLPVVARQSVRRRTASGGALSRR